MLRSDLAAAFMLLTRLPVPGSAGAPDVARCVWAFPVVGLVVNLAAGLVYRLGYEAGLPPLLAAAWTVAAALAMTGAFHEDGLADTADGFGGGGSRERKLEIMRDSRIGSFGALALLLSVLVRVAAISALARPGVVAAALVAAGMLGRSGMVLLVIAIRPARADGMGASMGGLRVGPAAAGLGMAVAASFALLPARPAAAVVLLSVAVSLGMAKLAAAQIGGYTGDVLGACEVATECVVLTAGTVAFGA
nr:adenosylcobinamide-GDP ribazoletransferase [uncultured Rhodopila sp.]